MKNIKLYVIITKISPSRCLPNSITGLITRLTDNITPLNVPQTASRDLFDLT